ncbi:hypothetical protein DFQ10_10666 [Winogradskyella eximia]|jgi:hypothetical protein|uniref:HTH cro/C1-type domain-containing protein n=1 Tax=Winogradskyella eximia TaxID=262006 RepID=A0A3D9H0W9_9FLAO|nr:hypothetical protein [Winogradskyella eximia]RED43154.1 hypothetical protein DFQ10_10666 [Winogradskyella eximia]|tara:strand:- start:69 stop:476 length:408 start_codon:yes stop_codon:yes gene_type:complete
MKKNDVPQDDGGLEKDNIKELCYAVDEKGEYTTIKSTGWDPKTIALDNALQEINERINNAKERVLNGETSPIEYYMECHKMDIGILASYVGKFQWQVKNHFKVKKFNKLSEKTLAKYASVFDISIDQLKDINYGN